MTTPSGPAPSAVPWPEETFKEGLANPALALSVLDLHLNSYKWVHHRLQRVTFLDETTFRQSFIIDLTVPAHAPELFVGGMKTVQLLPIDLLRKQNLVNFNLQDQKGQLLPHFTRDQLEVVTTTLLVEFAKIFLSEPPPDDLVQYLNKLVASDLKNIKEENDEWRTEVIRGAKALRTLDNTEEFNFILQRLTDSFILLVPTEADVGMRLKICYSLDLPIRKYFKDPRTRWKRWCEQFGWRETSIDFPLTAAADTTSYNFEVEDPPGIDLFQAAIVEYRAAKEETPQSPILHDWQRGGVTRLNLHAHEAHRSSTVVAHVDIEDSNEFWLRALIITAFVLGALLLVGAWRLPGMLAAESPGTNEVAATLLLFLAGVIATLLLRSDPLGLLRGMLKHLRRIATFTAAIPIVAVSFILYFSGGAQLRWALIGCGIAAVLTGTLALGSYFLPIPPQEPPKY